MFSKITGRNPSGTHLEKIKSSPNYKNNSFQNLSPTPMKPPDVSYWKMFREFFKKHPDTFPAGELPHIKTDLRALHEDSTITWFGHSSYLLRINSKTILVDPVFSGSAAPFSFMVKAFRGTDIFMADDMPAIDFLVLTHDHYDHLDFRTIKKLKSKIGKVICSLGIKSHLEYWGVNENIITELDWWETTNIGDEDTLTAAPARHFSGRGPARGKTLWSSFVLKTPSLTIYIGGDSGYDSLFRQIGDRFGPFDLAILETGQYNTMWPLIHMMPEEAVQAALDLRARTLLPVHWGKFRLAMHAWNEPVRRVVAKASQLKMPVYTPKIGETIKIGSKPLHSPWWE